MPGPPAETQRGIALAHEEFASYIHGSAVKPASVASASASDAMTRTATLSERLRGRSTHVSAVESIEFARATEPRGSDASSADDPRDPTALARARENY